MELRYYQHGLKQLTVHFLHNIDSIWDSELSVCACITYMYTDQVRVGMVVSYSVPSGNECKQWLKADFTGKCHLNISHSSSYNSWIICLSEPDSANFSCINITPIGSNQLLTAQGEREQVSSECRDRLTERNQTIVVHLHLMLLYFNSIHTYVAYVLLCD